MPIYKYRNLGKYGVMTDIPAYDLPNEGWTMANNIRFVANRFQKVGGFSPTLQPPTDGNHALMFTQIPETNSIIYGTEKNLFIFDGTVPQNVSLPTTAPDKHYQATPEFPWDYTVLSNVVIMNNERDVPQAWTPGIGANKKVVPLPGWGKHKFSQTTTAPWTARKIRAYKNYLVALNMTEDSDGLGGATLQNYPQRVRWSNVAYIDALPPDWNDDGVGISTGTTSDGGFNDLADCSGVILDGRPMRDSFMIYTNRETYVMDFVGGQLMFSFRKLFPDSGLLNPNCVCEFEGSQHFVVSEDDVFIHDGSTKQSIATDIIKEYLLNQITSSNYKATKVFPYPTRKEIWVVYNTMSSESGDVDNYACNKAAIWNWATGQWSFTDMPDTYWMEFLLSPTADTRTWRNPDQQTLVAPTKIVLDSPVYSLPVNKTFRLDVIYNLGEGLGANQRLKWTSSDNSKIDLSNRNTFDWSVMAKGLAEGEVTITATVSDWDGTTETPSTDPNLTSSYKITITPATISDPADPTRQIPNDVGDRHMKSDTVDFTYDINGKFVSTDPDGILDRLQDPKEPIPASDRAASPNPTGPVGDYRLENYTDPNNTWSTTQSPTEVWEQKGFGFSSRSLMASSSDKAFYLLDFGTLQSRYQGQTVPVTAEITRYAIPMADVEDSLGRHKTWRTMYPLLSGYGTLRFNVGGSEDAYQPPTFVTSSTFTIGQDYKVDCFVNNKYLALQIRDEGEGEWSMSGMDVDYFLGGLR